MKETKSKSKTVNERLFTVSRDHDNQNLAPEILLGKEFMFITAIYYRDLSLFVMTVTRSVVRK